MPRSFAVFCAVFALFLLPVTAAAQINLSPLSGDDPHAHFLEGLLEPLIANDQEAMVAWLEQHISPEANAAVLAERLGKIASVVHEETGVRVGGFLRASDGGVGAVLLSESEKEFAVGVSFDEGGTAVRQVLAVPAWRQPPPTPESTE